MSRAPLQPRTRASARFPRLLSRILHVSSLPILSLLLPTVLTTTGKAGELHIAVASNFREAAEAMTNRFMRDTAVPVTLVFGSTGKLYAQIRNGAPFDVFMAADRERPERLEKEGRAVPRSRHTYALGRLVLWSPDKDRVDAEGKVLARGEFPHLALANPRLAPYGRAAQEVLEARHLWNPLKDRLVMGENISQTYQFVHSGHAPLGFVAWSQLHRPGRPVPGSYWRVPDDLHQPIDQQVILLKDSVAAQAWLGFLLSDGALKILQDYGYDAPP